MKLRSTARTERKWGSKRDSSSVVVASLEMTSHAATAEPTGLASALTSCWLASSRWGYLQ
jgi:hypothetical protein